MESKILQSVVEITKQRNLDSMESSLVATLAQLLPLTYICILKSIEDKHVRYAEEVASLTIDHNKEDPYCWNVDSNIIRTDEHFDACINTASIISYQHTNGHTRHLFPISEDSQAIGCLVIDTNKNLSHHMSLIEGFAKVYENYMIVFNESERDKLTGLFNRRTFDNKLSKLFKTQRHRSLQNYLPEQSPDRRIINNDDTAWLIITDIDHFKRVNDTYGHIYGDEVILTISQIMKSCFRNSDLLFRVGGEEFVILLGASSQKIAESLIERFLKTVEEHEFSDIGTVTVSAGYARITEKDYPPAVLECADKALYYAKEHGRNCSYYYELLVEQGEIIEPKKGGSVDLF
ncbi:MAG: GGDEF domain-containing protein [Gammaproteobacteria bacterium]|nr:GGDEF domain-containing protein [Gammaproteobacteria bacterium]